MSQISHSGAGREREGEGSEICEKRSGGGREVRFGTREGKEGRHGGKRDA